MYRVFTGLLFLLPLAFLPFSFYPIDSFKSFFLMILTTVVFFTWILFSLLRKDAFFLKTKAYALYVIFLLLALISCIMTSSFKNSFFGTTFEIGTWISLFFAGMAMVMAGRLFTKNIHILHLTKLLALSGWIVGLYHLLKILVPKVFLVGSLPSLSFSLVGNIHSTSIYFGLIALLCVGILDNEWFEKRTKTFFSITAVFASLFVFCSGYLDVWIVFGCGLLVTFLLSLNATKKSVEEKKELYLPLHSLIFLTSTILMLLVGPLFIPRIANTLGFAEQEVRPSMTTSAQIFANVVKKADFVGPGLNNFSKVWRQYRPTDIQQPDLYEIDFSQAFGTIPTIAINTGILGFLALLLFIVFILYTCVARVLKRSRYEHSLIEYIAPISALYLLYFSIFYTPSITLWYLTFVFLGIVFVVDKSSTLAVRYKRVREQRPRIFGVSIAVVCILAVISVSYTVKSFIANIYFAHGVDAYNEEGDVQKAEKNILFAIQSSRSDVYMRTLSSIYAKNLYDLYSGNTTLEKEEATVAFERTLAIAENVARSAIAYDRDNALNWANLGSLYEPLIPLKVVNAFENTITAYTEASTLDPHSAQRILALARVYYHADDVAKAREYVQNSLKVNNAYAPAYFLWAQIEIDEKNISDGEKYLQQAVSLGVNNFDIQVGYGQYMLSKKLYREAEQAFVRAVLLQHTDINARFFLALTYAKQNKISEARDMLQSITILSPGIIDVETVLTEMQQNVPEQLDVPILDTNASENIVKSAEN